LLYIDMAGASETLDRSQSSPSPLLTPPKATQQRQRQQQGSASPASYYKRLVAIRAAAFGDDDASVGVLSNSLGVLLAGEGEHEEAVEYFQRARRCQAAVLGPTDPDTLLTSSNMGCSLVEIGTAPSLERALALLQETAEMQARVCGASSPFTWFTRAALGWCLFKAGRIHDAEVELARALSHQQSLAGADSIGVEVTRTVEHLAVVKAARAAYDKKHAPKTREELEEMDAKVLLKLAAKKTRKTTKQVNLAGKGKRITKPELIDLILVAQAPPAEEGKRAQDIQHTARKVEADKPDDVPPACETSASAASIVDAKHSSDNPVLAGPAPRTLSERNVGDMDDEPRHCITPRTAQVATAFCQQMVAGAIASGGQSMHTSQQPPLPQLAAGDLADVSN
jgi:Tfp pilus assembly protein PilF